MRTVIAMLIAVISCMAALAAPAPLPKGSKKPSLVVSIALPALHGQRRLPLGESVAVVVLNVSKEPIRVWRDWCSWGYCNISLVFRDGDGKQWEATKAPRGWTKNYPDFAELAPGESIIFSVPLADSVWRDLPSAKEFAGKRLQMSVRYHIGEDQQSWDKRVWTGDIRTAFQEYTIGP